MSRVPFQQSVTAIVAAGRAVGRLTPGVAGSSWKVQRMVTTTSLGPSVPCQLDVYKNVESFNTRIDGTTSAGQDTSTDDDIDIDSTDTLLAIWSNVANGTTCTLTISGILDTGR